MSDRRRRPITIYGYGPYYGPYGGGYYYRRW